MTIIGIKFSPRFFVLFAMVALALFGSGCATSMPTSGAPRSNLSRTSALSMAQMMATAVGGQVFTVAPTGSMKPTLDESSVVTVESVDFTDLRTGDIVIYRSAEGLPVIHRLYEKQGRTWLVLGDNNASIDREAVTARNLVGRVCAIFYTSSGSAPSGSAAFARR